MDTELSEPAEVNWAAVRELEGEITARAELINLVSEKLENVNKILTSEKWQVAKETLNNIVKLSTSLSLLMRSQLLAISEVRSATGYMKFYYGIPEIYTFQIKILEITIRSTPFLPHT